jgi:triosephosphate isomerase
MTSRKPLIAGNWKMFKTSQEANETASKLVELVTDASHTEIMIAPPFTALSTVAEIVKGSNVSLGAQNLFWENEGAYTGEISSAMLVSTGCRYVIIGHSERRQFFGETDEMVNKKINSAVKNGLIPILCLGESEKERDADETFSILDKQIKRGLESFSSENLKTLVIAYEPIWAIGTGKTASSDQAQEVHCFLRESLDKLFNSSLSESIRILYGGSVKPDNIKELMEKPDVDGALVGGASLQAESFSKIVNFS